MKHLVLFAFCLTAACDNLAPAARILPLNRVNAPGVLLSPPGSSLMTGAVWSADGSRVYVGLLMPADANRGRQNLHEIIVASGEDRILKDTVALTSLGRSPDGRWLYYTAAGLLWRLPFDGGTAQLVRNETAYFWHVTDDGAGLVYGWPGSDTVWVAGSQGAKATALPRGHPVTYSPAGDEMLYCCADPTGSGSSALIVSLATGATRPAGLAVDSGTYWVGTRWEAAGIRMLIARYDPNRRRLDYTIRGPAGPEAATFSDTTAGVAWKAAWSPDGSRVAFWKSACVSWDSFIGECGVHSALYVADLRAGVTSWVAGADLDAASDEVGCPIFSPDGRYLVYALSGGLYLSQVP
jgi:sugar lactone lactonase YvrE